MAAITTESTEMMFGVSPSFCMAKAIRLAQPVSR